MGVSLNEQKGHIMATENQCQRLEALARNRATADALRRRIEASPRLSEFLLDIYFLACLTIAH